MDYLLYAFHIVVLLFWIRLWSAPSREFYFNPFLSGTARLTDSAIAFLRPVLALPEQAAALVVILFVLLFKTLLFWRLGGEWTISIGTNFVFSPHGVGETFLPLFLFSALQATLFIVRLWTVYLLVRLITPPARNTRASEALAFFARPFSAAPFWIQPAVLFACHLLIVFVLTRIETLQTGPALAQTPFDGTPAQGAPRSPFLDGPLYEQLLKTGWLAALSFADGLKLLVRSLFILILANFGTALLQMHGAALLCNEGVELLLGRFARRGTARMGFDFTPLIFIFIVDLMYNSICQGLYTLIQSPFFNGLWP
jgi:hypothetical protein